MSLKYTAMEITDEYYEKYKIFEKVFQSAVDFSLNIIAQNNSNITIIVRRIHHR
jgi:hypothetical protein